MADVAKLSQPNPIGGKALLRPNLVTSLTGNMLMGAVLLVAGAYGMRAIRQHREAKLLQEEQEIAAVYAPQVRLSYAADLRETYQRCAASTTDDEHQTLRATLLQVAQNPAAVLPPAVTPRDPFRELVFRKDSSIVPRGVPWAQIYRQFVYIVTDLSKTYADYLPSSRVQEK